MPTNNPPSHAENYKHTCIWSHDCIAICAVVGLAFDEGEIDEICTRFALNTRGIQDTYYQYYLLHRAAHEAGSAAATHITTLLNSRFAKIIQQVRRMKCESESEIAAQLALVGTLITAGLLWALLTDPRDHFYSYGVYLNHQLSLDAFRSFRQTGNMLENHRTAEAAAKTAEQALLKLKKQRAKAEELRRRNLKLENERDQLRFKLVRQQGELDKQVARTEELNQLKRKLRKAEYLLNKQEEKPGDEQAAEDVETHIPAKEAAPETEDPPCGTCSGLDSCPLETLRVAVVGGLERLEPNYRRIVQEMGGDFAFHCGDCHGGIHRLKNVVCKSNIVCFFTQLNSHSALHVVKGICQKSGKKFVAIRGTGPQALAKVLREVA